MAQPTVLVAEDDKLIRGIFVEIARGHGFDVIEACDGQRALELLDSQRIDMIITDMKMPLLSGFELLQAVKAAHPEIPLTVITGFNSEYGEEEAMTAGADRYITKPFKVADVASALEQMHQRVQQRTAAQLNPQ
jgi:CheY-like chemotaxis protein